MTLRPKMSDFTTVLLLGEVPKGLVWCWQQLPSERGRATPVFIRQWFLSPVQEKKVRILTLNQRMLNIPKATFTETSGAKTSGRDVVCYFDAPGKCCHHMTSRDNGGGGSVDLLQRLLIG